MTSVTLKAAREAIKYARTATILCSPLIVALSFVVTYRLYSVLLARRHPRSQTTNKKSFAVLLGSGGHTTEALALVSALDFDRYTPRTYIISEGDTLSARKAAALEKTKKPGNTDYEIVTMPRARRVHQPLLTTPLSAFVSFVWTLRFMTFDSRPERIADALLVNGPGTCVILALGVYVNRFLGLPSPRIIYVESFARVNSLSLSGKLMKPMADRFVIQWPKATESAGSQNVQYRGWLV